MTETLAFETWDVFTDRPFRGNPLAVVHGADRLATAQMQALAREFNLSETVFVLAPDAPGHRARLRIFHPSAEMPFAGHPTIGAAIALNAADGGGTGGFVLGTNAGPVPVRLRRAASGVAEAEFTAPVLGAPAGGMRAPEALAPGLGLAAGQIGFDGHRPGHWVGGPDFLFVPVADLAALAAARPCQPDYDRIGAGRGSTYVYTRDPAAPTGYRARMFAQGRYEDPATGSASAILAAKLLASGALPEGETQVPLTQGVEMGRPSRIGLTAVVRDGALAEVRISGQAVPVSRGRVAVPPAAPEND